MDVVPPDLRGRIQRVAVIKTSSELGKMELTVDGAMRAADSEKILRRHNATLLDPAALGEGWWHLYLVQFTISNSNEPYPGTNVGTVLRW